MMQTWMTPFHDWLVDLRRHFHRFPELAYREERTAEKIADVLRSLDVPCETGIGKTGIIARLQASEPGPAVAFRADMDALPIGEQSDVSYRSTHVGRMHACGHDGHMAIALGVLRLLQVREWRKSGRGTVLVIFQPAEEGGAGARAMLEDGFRDQEVIGAILAGHMHPELPTGQIGMSQGVTNAASDTIRIRLTGKGGHGAHPHLCIDPIVGGAYLVGELQSIISRNISSSERAVLTIGRFHAGTAENIIPQEAVLEGTLRTLSREVRNQIVDRLHALVHGIAAAHRLEVDLAIIPGYPLVVNNTRLVQVVAEEASRVLGAKSVHIQEARMGAEDFAYFLERYPGVLIRIGCHYPDKGFEYGLHSPHFDIDERALDVGVTLFTHLLQHLTESLPDDGNTP